ncbi:DCN [Lemmus lemmus]
MKTTLLLLLLAQVSWAGPFEQRGLFDFMLEDEASGVGPEDSGLPPDLPHLEPLGPVCPFRCQCHLRVVQCSDLGLDKVPKDLPPDTTLLDLQNNKITEIKDGDFKSLKNLHTLILVNNKINKISSGAFTPLVKLERLYLSKNQLKELPDKMPKTLQELRAHENEITKVRKSVFNGLNQMIVIELGTNPLKNSGIENGAFQGMKRLSYIRIADTNITAIPQEGLANLSSIHLQYNQLKEDAVSASLRGLKSLMYLDLSFNQIAKIPNGLPASLQTLYLDNNKISGIPEEYFKRFTGLQYLRLSHNQLTDSGVPGNSFNISSLLELDLSYNKLKSIPNVNENLENYYLEVNELESKYKTVPVFDWYINC